MSKFLFGLIIISIGMIGFVILSLSLPGKEFIIENQVASFGSFSDQSEEKSKITLLAVGDIMLSRGVEYYTKKANDWKFPFLKIRDELKKADILFGNLEGPISEKGIKSGSIYSFRAKPEAVEGLIFAGFDILSLANNHMLDYQREALEDTMSILKENGIDYVGAGFNEKEAFSVKIREIKGTKVGFLAMTDLGPEVWRAQEKNSGIAWISEKDLEKIKQEIKGAKEKVDILIVSLHFGEEYSQEPTARQVSFSRAFVEAGADLIIGHHPHVIQEIEKYREGYIFYSLGNFVFDQGFSEETREGLLLEVIIKNKKIKEIFPKKIKISESFQPYLLEENEVIQRESLKDLNQIKANFISLKLSFLEVNLSEMKIKIYEKGDLLKEVSIFTRGDPDRWGGTSLGVYQVLSKHRVAFSQTAQSFMPWAIHIYGKYYIHGDNWYSGGRLDTSPITGGCIRLSNKDAEIIYELSQEEMPILVTEQGFENDDFKYPPSKNLNEFPQLSAKSYLVADLDSSFVFSEKDSQTKLPIASLTKLMTSIIISEIVDLRKSILVKPEMLEAFGSTEELVAGKSFKAIELFYPLLIESSNDAAEVLSYFLGREKTIQLMNEKTKAILMEKTNFADPSGIDKNNLSTAQDLFYLAKYILNSRPPILKISKGEEVWTFGIPLRFKNLKNKNIFFNQPNFLGGKTGYTHLSKHTGLFIFRFPTKNGPERNLVIVLLGSENLEDDVGQILNWLKENYFVIEDFEIGEKTLTPPSFNLPPRALISCEPSPECGTEGEVLQTSLVILCVILLPKLQS